MIDFITNYFADFDCLKACGLLGTLTGFLVMWFQIKQNILLWYCNIISASLLCVVFFAKDIYAYAFFQIYYIVTSVYGIYSWKKGAENNNDTMPIRLMRAKEWLISLSVVVACSVGIYAILKATNASAPILDAIITSISAVATFLLTKKYLQYWFFWIVADCLYVSTIINLGTEELYTTLLLYVAYIVSSIFGFLEWNKKFKLQESAL